MSNTHVSVQVDVRNMEPRLRHPLIFKTFDGLTNAESMELVNDHDPMPLYYQMQAVRPGEFDWTAVEQGPEVWRIQITKMKKP